MKTSITPLVVVALGLLHLVQLMPVTNAPAKAEENFLSEAVKDGFLVENPPAADGAHATEVTAQRNATAQLFTEEEEESGSGSGSGGGMLFEEPSTTTTAAETTVQTTTQGWVADWFDGDHGVLFHTTTEPSPALDLTTTTGPPSTTTQVGWVADWTDGDHRMLFHTTTEPSPALDLTTTTGPPSTTTQVGWVADSMDGHHGRMFHGITEPSPASDLTTTTAAPANDVAQPEEELISSGTSAMKYVSKLKVNPTPSKQGAQAGSSGWMIIVGFVVGVAALVLICIAIATKDSWNGPSQATIEAERNGRSGVQPEKQEMEEFLPEEERQDSEYTMVPLSELSES